MPSSFVAFRPVSELVRESVCEAVSATIPLTLPSKRRQRRSHENPSCVGTSGRMGESATEIKPGCVTS